MPTLDRRQLAAVSIGGAIGALARVGLGEAFAGGAPSWPWVTFSINVSGSLLLGYFITRLQERQPLSTYRRPLLGTGFCGAFTTFSTLQLEVLKMIDHHRDGLAAAYIAASVACGYLAIFVATATVRRVRAIV